MLGFPAYTCEEFSLLCVYTVILSCFAVIAPMIHSLELLKISHYLTTIPTHPLRISHHYY